MVSRGEDQRVSGRDNFKAASGQGLRKKATGGFDTAVSGSLDKVPARRAQEEEDEDEDEDEALNKRAEASFGMWKAKRMVTLPATIDVEEEDQAMSTQDDEEVERELGSRERQDGEVDQGVVLVKKGSGRIDESLLEQLESVADWTVGLEGFDEEEEEDEDEGEDLSDSDSDEDDDDVADSLSTPAPRMQASAIRGQEGDDESWGIATVLMPIDASGASFEQLGVKNQILLSNIARVGFRSPTAVQESSLPYLLQGQDIIINAFTGSGKTAAYLIPAIEQLLSSNDGKAPPDGPPRILVISPSRELAIQVLRAGEELIKDTGLRIQQIIGGANPNRQIEDVKKKKPHIIVGTPGRLAELSLDMGRLKLSGARHVVVDEVDQCLGDAFRDDVQALLKGCNKEAQVVFASATGGRKDVVELAKQHMQESATMLEMAGRRRLPPQLKHYVIESPKMKFLENLRRLYYVKGMEGMLVFVNDGRRVDIVCDKLLESGLVAAPLKGESEKDDRQEIMRRLRAGTLGEKALVVATEVAARGLDIPNLTHVVNLDLPTDAEHYVHRAGRTARAGREGTSVLLCEPQMGFVIDKIGRKLGIEFESASIVANEIVSDGF